MVSTGARSPRSPGSGGAMKGLAFFAIVIVIAPIGLFNPFYGMMYYNWFALMKPEWLFYGFPHSIPVAMIVAICTFLGWLFSKERKVPPFDATTWLVLILCVWMGITTLFALDRSLAWTKYNDMIKVQLFALIFYAMLTSPDRVKIALWVLGLSIALFGAKGGVKSIITGGSYRIYGPDHSIINDNNDF